jgi:hypothetical protein
MALDDENDLKNLWISIIYLAEEICALTGMYKMPHCN